MVSAICGKNLFHSWQWGPPYGAQPDPGVRRDVHCKRCGVWAYGIGVFSNGARAEFVARAHKIGRYASD